MGGGGILESLCPCVCLFMYLSLGLCQNISSEQLNLLYPNQIWWCIVLSQYVMHKNWDVIFKIIFILSFYCDFSTGDPSATKLSLISRLPCEKTVDCFVQSQVNI